MIDDEAKISKGGRDRESPFRLFHLTISVYVPRGTPLPETFSEWVERAGFEVGGASPTSLERVVELRFPLAADVIDKRTGDKITTLYG